MLLVLILVFKRETVHLCLQRWGEEGSVVGRKKRGPARKTTVSKTQDIELVNGVQHNGLAQIQDLTESLQVASSTSRLRENQF